MVELLQNYGKASRWTSFSKRVLPRKGSSRRFTFSNGQNYDDATKVLKDAISLAAT
jgi:hypothetical protein